MLYGNGVLILSTTSIDTFTPAMAALRSTRTDSDSSFNVFTKIRVSLNGFVGLAPQESVSTRNFRSISGIRHLQSDRRYMRGRLSRIWLQIGRQQLWCWYATLGCWYGAFKVGGKWDSCLVLDMDVWRSVGAGAVHL